jgi:hypothetical protein
MEQMGSWFRGETQLSDVPVPKPGFWSWLLHLMAGERWREVDWPLPVPRTLVNQSRRDEACEGERKE